MSKITHYEVYAGRGGSWKLEGRYPGPERDLAFSKAKEKEKSGTLAVKVVREDFDIKTGSYQESVEYVSGLSNNNLIRQTSGKNKKESSLQRLKYKESFPKKKLLKSDIFTALLILSLIILICLFLSNLIITLLLPVIELLVAEEKIKTVMFLVFFVLFLIMAIPLVLSKVPWYVFSNAKNKKIDLLSYDKKLFNKAEQILKRYNLNEDYEQLIAPSYPEAPISYRRYIVAFLGKIIETLGTGFSFQNSFNKLGVKLIIYGGCMELSRRDKLKINEANSLLFEAFKIIDGKANLIAFYEAKRTYSDNKEAIYLTGVGAYLMSLIIKKYPIDKDLLRASFAKWQRLNVDKEETAGLKKNTMFNCLVNLQNIVFSVEDLEEDQKEIDKIKKKTKEIISNVLEGLNPAELIENHTFLSINFLTLNDALSFSVRFFEHFSAYAETLEDYSLMLENKCSITSFATKDFNLIEDIFENVYDNEIILDEHAARLMDSDEYGIDFLGEKYLKKTGRKVALYKLIF